MEPQANNQIDAQIALKLNLLKLILKFTMHKLDPKIYLLQSSVLNSKVTLSILDLTPKSASLNIIDNIQHWKIPEKWSPYHGRFTHTTTRFWFAKQINI